MQMQNTSAYEYTTLHDVLHTKKFTKICEICDIFLFIPLDFHFKLFSTQLYTVEDNMHIQLSLLYGFSTIIGLLVGRVYSHSNESSMPHWNENNICGPQ